MEAKEIIQKLRNELDQLRQKIMNLKIFMLTTKFADLCLEKKAQGELLKEQLKVMFEYQNILIKRIALLQDDIDNGELNDTKR